MNEKERGREREEGVEMDWERGERGQGKDERERLRKSTKSEFFMSNFPSHHKYNTKNFKYLHTVKGNILRARCLSNYKQARQWY